jgi:hypothetical protein
MDEIVRRMVRRARYDEAAAKASIAPSKSSKISAQKAAEVPVTGLRTDGGGAYGGLYTSAGVETYDGRSVTLPLR